MLIAAIALFGVAGVLAGIAAAISYFALVNSATHESRIIRAILKDEQARIRVLINARDNARNKLQRIMDVVERRGGKIPVSVRLEFIDAAADNPHPAAPVVLDDDHEEFSAR